MADKTKRLSPIARALAERITDKQIAAAREICTLADEYSRSKGWKDSPWQPEDMLSSAVRFGLSELRKMYTPIERPEREQHG